MSQLDEEMPPEVAHALGQMDLAKQEKLDAVGKLICEKREEAIKSRKASGIEETWLECEEAYIGMDDENRDEFQGAKWAKPTYIEGPLTRRTNSSNGVRSNAFVPATARYVDAGHAKVCEITLPQDDKAFSFSPTPVPELIDAKDGDTQIKMNGVPLERDATPDDKEPQDPVAALMPKPPQPQGQPGGAQPETVPLTDGDLAKELMEKATDAAKKAEKRIYDWMIECQYTAEMRKVIFDGARLGTGILKAPFPMRKSNRAMEAQEDGTLKFTMVEKIQPGAEWVDLWDFFPDGSCGESVQEGSYVFHRAFLSERRVEDLKKQPGYIKEQIDKVLKEGPDGKVNEDGSNPGHKNTDKDKRYTVWYFTGVLSREDMATLKAVGLDDLPEDQEDVHAVVTVINDIPVKATVNPLESGEFNYHVFQWRRRPGSWHGVGVAEQMRTAQRIWNAATRALLTNAGKSAGSQVVLNRGMIEPADKNWSLTPDKLWYLAADATVDDVRKAFTMFPIPNMTSQLLSVIQYAREIAEESTNIPLISQGQSGKTTPDTLGGMQLQDNNANQLLRGIANQLDDCITEPVVRQFYEWLLLDPDVPNDEKGDWEINAHGSVAMVNTHLQTQAVLQMGNMVANPAFGIDPAKYFTQLAKAQKLDPREFTFSEEELAKMKEQPPTPPPAVQVAQIRAQTDIQRIKVDTDRDTVFVQSQDRRDQADAEFKLQELQVRRELALLEYANKKELTLEQVKAGLAETTIKENTRKELAAAELMVSQRENMLERTHDKGKHDVKLPALGNIVPGVGSINNSVVRDEMTTNTTP